MRGSFKSAEATNIPSLSGSVQLRYEIKFSEPRISKPAVREADASGAELQALTPLYPAEARLRNLTYAQSTA